MTHGTWIPRLVLERADIPLSAKLLYGLIDALDGDEGCFASNGWIATNLGLGKRQVQNLLTTLIDAGLVVRVEREGKRYLQTIEKAALSGAKRDATNCTPPVQSVTPPPCNSLHPYNTEDNKEDKTNPLPLPLPHGEPFKRAWAEWVHYRKRTSRALSQFASAKQLKMLGAMTEDEACRCIERSILNDWQGLFVDTSKPKGNTKTLSSTDHHNGF
jgi:DNA-binding transcriptional ArsR family regulator